MSEKRIMLIIGIISIVFLVGSTVVLTNNTTPAKELVALDNAKVEVLENKFDWGIIDYDGEKATKTFTIKNAGSDLLQITNIKTSCACTKAQLIIDELSSPFFSMHSVSSWVGEIKPGKEAKLSIEFDQRAHGPTGVGEITRLITLQTNDSKNPKLEFELKGTVVRNEKK